MGGTVIVVPASETSPVSAMARPVSTEPVNIEIESCAMMVPIITEVVPIVAELPICQKTLPAWAPFDRMTWRPDVVVKADATWKMNTPWGSPPPLRVRSPEEIARDDVDLYSPGVRVSPPMLPEMVTGQFVRPLALL